MMRHAFSRTRRAGLIRTAPPACIRDPLGTGPNLEQHSLLSETRWPQRLGIYLSFNSGRY